MARINLLPWREERRKLRNRESQTLFAITAFAAVLVVLAIMWQCSQMIANQSPAQPDPDPGNHEGRRQDQGDRSAREDAQQAAAAQGDHRAAAGQPLDDGSHLFDDLVRTIPEGVRLSSIKQNGDTLTLEGFAESNARVSGHAQPGRLALDGQSRPRDRRAKGPDKRSRYVFTLRVNLRKPDADGNPSTTPPGEEDATTQGASP